MWNHAYWRGVRYLATMRMCAHVVACSSSFIIALLTGRFVILEVVFLVQGGGRDCTGTFQYQAMSTRVNTDPASTAANSA